MRRSAFGFRVWVLGFGFWSLVIGHWSFTSAAAPDDPPKPHPDVQSLIEKGEQAYQAYKFDDALRLFNEALTQARALKDKAGEARTLNNIGAVYHALGQPQKALEYLQQALPLRREIGDKADEAETLNSIGVVYLYIGQLQKALEFLQQTLPLCREVGDKRGEAATLNNIGGVYYTLGQPQKALELFQQALPLTKEVGDKRNEAVTLNNIGLAYNALGQWQKALEFYQQSLPLHRAVGGKAGEAATLSNIGGVYHTLGQPQKALGFYQQSLSLHRAVGDKEGEAVTLNNIGGAYDSLGQPQKALELYQQSLPLRRESGDKEGEAATLHNIGGIYDDIGQPQKALEYYQQALPLQREVGDKVGEARTLSNIAYVEESQGRLVEASRDWHDTVMILEGIRESLGGLSEAKVSFLESNLASYHRYINLLLKQNNPADAFTWAQKTKARALLDLMYDGKVDVSQVMTKDERERERALKWQAGQFNKQLVAETTRQKPDAARVKTLKEQLAKAESELQTFTDALYVKYPDLARKRAAKTVTLEEVAQFLPPDTALLDYVVLKARNVDKTVLFCVTTEQGKAVVGTYEIAKPRDKLAEMAISFRNACASPMGTYQTKARDLYALLVAPAAKQLAGKKRLIICPDGVLWGLPFQALMVNGRNPKSQIPNPKSSERFLIEQYEITYAYSATAAQAALLSRDGHGADAKRPKPTGTLLAMANPDFGGGERFKGGALAAATRDVFLRGGGLTPLPASQREANALKAGFPDAVVYTGAKAQEATAKQDGGKFRYLHFATHGLLNDAAPLMSSIALAQPPQGSDEDGFLTAREIFDLNLSAEMVVLSACNTARGERRGGEGVVGLTWALFVAGAPTQVLSQWAVADESTATLMKQFYAHLKAGKPKGAALRAAMLGLMKDGKHRHPFYWAPFVLMGDWR